MRVAVLLGDERLVARCCVHLVYCRIQMGHFRRAMRMLRALQKLAGKWEDTVLGTMVVSGQRYCRNTYKLYAEGKLAIAAAAAHRDAALAATAASAGTASSVTAASSPHRPAISEDADEFYRQRLVLPVALSQPKRR